MANFVRNFFRGPNTAREQLAIGNRDDAGSEQTAERAVQDGYGLVQNESRMNNPRTTSLRDRVLGRSRRSIGSALPSSIVRSSTRNTAARTFQRRTLSTGDRNTIVPAAENSSQSLFILDSQASVSQGETPQPTYLEVEADDALAPIDTRQLSLQPNSEATRQLSLQPSSQATHQLSLLPSS
jgi:hypothetical protein